MNISPRTELLIGRLPNHPLSASMRNAMIEALAAGEQFADHKSTLARDGRMTPVGQQAALREALTNTFGKAWARAKAPVAKARADVKARKAALTVKPVDPTNLSAALERSEIRAWVRQLDLGVRQAVVLATKDVRILEALLSAPPELSGIVDAVLAGKVEDRYLELVYPQELAELEALDSVVSEAEASIQIARNEMQSTIDIHPHDFSELMRPVETHRPWLTKDGLQVVEVSADDKATYRKASESEIADGVRYENLEAFKRAQGLADAA